jgi:hypothetical protein
MTEKEKAIENLESVAYWMKNSKTDYDLKDLHHVLMTAIYHYENYLKEKEYEKYNSNSKS